MHNFKVDIITPTSIESLDGVNYLRIPALDGLTGVQAKHANSIIALDIGEIKIVQNNKETIYATSGGFADIRKEGTQLLLETFESSKTIDKKRAEQAIEKANLHLKNKNDDLKRAKIALRRAQNRLTILKKF